MKIRLFTLITLAITTFIGTAQCNAINLDALDPITSENATQLIELAYIPTTDDSLANAVFSLDGQLIVIGQTNTGQLLDTSTLLVQFTLGVDAEILPRTLHFNDSGEQLVIQSIDYRFIVWTLQQPLVETDSPILVNGSEISLDGTFYTWETGAISVIFDLLTGELIGQFSPSGRSLISPKPTNS